MTPFSIIATSLLCSGTWAATHELNWNLAMKKVKPDGNKNRQVVSINDQWPLPVIEINQGDRLVVNVTNNLKKPVANSSVHFYGMFQNGTTDMDGQAMVSQCPEVTKSSFIYNFTIDQPGTYWYEIQSDNIDMSSSRQMLLVNDDKAWFQSEVHEDIAISLSDWYGDNYYAAKDKKFMVTKNANDTEPLPVSLLMNNTVAPKWEVESSKTYRLRLANTGAHTGFYVYIPGQNFTVVEVDGVYTQPFDTSMLYIASAQRYSVLFNTTSDTNAIYQLVQIADQSQYSSIDKKTVLNHTAFLYTGKHSSKDFVAANQSSIYASAPKNNQSSSNVTKFTSNDLATLDDFKLKPYDNQTLLSPVNVNHTLTISTGVLADKKPYAFFNDISWTSPKVPTLFSVLSANDNQTAMNSTIYGNNTESLVLNRNDVVQVIINNNDTAKYPLHLHGHNFQVVARGEAEDEFTPFDPEDDDINYFKVPMKRDTLVVEPNSFAIIRFRADNPGVWMFRTTNDWKFAQGLALEFVEAPADIREHYKEYPLAESHKTICNAAKVNMTGNAAGNTNDYYNLAGQNVQPMGAPTFTSSAAAPSPSVTSLATQRDYDTKSHERDYDTKSHERDYDTKSHERDYDTKSHERDYDTKSHERDYDTKSHESQCYSYNYKRYAKNGHDGEDCVMPTTTSSMSMTTASQTPTVTTSPSQCYTYNYKRYAKGGHDGECEEADTDTHSHEQDIDTKTHECDYNYKRYAKNGHDGECVPVTSTSTPTSTGAPATTSQCYYNYKRYAKNGECEPNYKRYAKGGHDGECEPVEESYSHDDCEPNYKRYAKDGECEPNYKRYAKGGHDGECEPVEESYHHDDCEPNYKRYAKGGHDGECVPVTSTTTPTSTGAPATTSQCYYNYKRDAKDGECEPNYKRYAKGGHDGECEPVEESYSHDDCEPNYKRYAKDGECEPNYKRYAKGGHDGECEPVEESYSHDDCEPNYKRYAKHGECEPSY